MDLHEIVAKLVTYLGEHWDKIFTAVFSLAVGWVFGKRRAWAEWRKKEFLHRLNISLNTLRDGQLLIRTIIETACAEVFLNSVASDAVTAAARQTTEQDPLLPLPKEDYWYYLNAVLNEVAEKFAEGQLKHDLGLPVQREKYLICLTCEKAGAVRTQKIRAMLIRKQSLEGLPDEPPALESPNHITRWKTLQFLAAEWRKNPYKFLELEICV